MMDDKKKKIPEDERYKELIREATMKVCEKDEKPPTCAKYEAAVAKLIEEKRGYKIEARTIHSSVYRALQNLVKHGEYIRVEKCYYPNKTEYLIFEIKNKVIFARADVYKMSSNTCVIELEEVSEDSLNLLAEYIGRENIFAIKALDNLVIIMLHKSTLIEAIERMVKETYEIQLKKPKKRKKGIRIKMIE